MLKKVVGDVRIDPGIVYNDKNTTSGAKPKAPGMRYKHYAPKGDLTIVSGEESLVVSTINKLSKQAIANGQRVGIISTSETADRYEAGEILIIGDRADESSIAHNLYDILRKFDELQVDVIYSESFATPKMGQAIMNRLLKAAGQKTIEV